MKTTLKFILFSCIVLLSVKTQAQVFAANNFTLVAQLDPETNPNTSGDKYSGCWGWYDAVKNKEYAIAGSVNGTFWVDITNPSTPTVSAYRAGKTGCIWREIKTYQNYCYVISDDPGVNSFQIFDMQYLPDSVHKVYDSQALFSRAHTLWVDGSKLYVASSSLGNNFSTMNVYSLANPASPVLIRRLDQDFPSISYVHDMYVRNDTVYASCAYQGLYIFNLTATNTFSLLGSLSNYAFSGYNHSSALTPDGRTLVFMDEVPSGLPVKVADVTNLGNVQVLATTNQFPQTTPHNPFMISNRYCMVSSYQDGLQLYDISTPASPVLAGYFDTHPQGGGNINSYLSGNDYNGQWGAYPYYPSKSVFALDRQNGIFILNSNLFNSTPPPTQTLSAGFTVQSSTACVGATVNFMNTSTAATNYTWSYTGGSSANATGTNLNLMFSIPGTYSVTLLAVNSQTSASVTQTITIKNNNLSSSTNFTHTSCSGCTDGIISVNMLGGTPPFTYNWLPSGGNNSTAGNLAANCYTVMVQDAANCSYNKEVCINITGLTAFATPAGLSVHPNPAQSILNMDYPGSTFNYELYSFTGQLVSSAKNNQQKVTLSVNELAKGIYILKVESGKNKTSQKIIVE